MPIFANIIETAFSPLISAFQWILVFIHDHILHGFGGWGLAIVGLTVLVRAVMVPLTMKQFRSMREMQVLQPQLKELQAKHKDDRQRQSEEMMKLYREHGVNPFASCLPLVLQIPILISLFYMLRTDLKLDICGQQMREYFSTPTHTIVHNSEIPTSGTHSLANVGCSQVPGGEHLASFLFIPDITLKATGVVLVVLIALYIITQLSSSLMMSTAVDRNQRFLMLGLPLIFIIFFIQYPAGLLVYWITTNIWTIGQQYYVRRRLGPPPAPPPKADKAKPSAGGRPKREPEPVLVGQGGTDSRANGTDSRGSNADGRANGTDSRKSDASATARSSGPPPRSPRKKKKRSGRRR
jgi:YidC/Oxa1 family membrane protein insertase